MRFEKGTNGETSWLSRKMCSLPGKSGKDSSSLWLPAWRHMMDTAGVMRYLYTDWLPTSVQMTLAGELPGGDLESVCSFLALTHDIGKLTPAFAARIAESLPGIREELGTVGIDLPPVASLTSAGKSPHALAGAAILQEYGCPPGIVAVVGAHHGKPMSLDDAFHLETQMSVFSRNYFGTSGVRSEAARAWRQVREEWFSFALHSSGYGSPDELPDLSQTAQVLLTGLLIMADWIASNTGYFPLIPADEAGSPDTYPARVDHALAKIALPDPWAPAEQSMDAEAFSHRFGFYPNEVQQAVLDVVNASVQPGIYILEAQMGVGKTEAALAAAEMLASRNGQGGLFFGLPTQATANGIFPRLKAWAERQSEDAVHAIRLAHGMASLNEEYRSLFGQAANNESGDLIVHSWFEGRKQALLADFVIGTVDQLLLAALKQKHVMLRHLGLSGKVVVIDECHAYDAYMSQYLDRALAWLGAYQVPVVLLSATLPAQRRAKLVEAYLGCSTGISIDGAEGWKTSRSYPLLTWTDGPTIRSAAISCSRADPRSVRIGRLADEAIPSFLQASLSDGGCAGVIVNTVRRAQELAAALRMELPTYEVLVFHSRYISTDRALREKELLRRLGKHSTAEQRSGLIVVGTQVMEQSLDIDFDLLLTDLCPMDLLLQRLGRLHRHPKRSRPAKLKTAMCEILGALDEDLEEGSRAVYGDWLLQRTRSLLPDRITLPEDIPALVQDTYETSEDALRVSLNENDRMRKAYEVYQSQQAIKEANARKYRIGMPHASDTIVDWLAADLSSTSAKAEASVRDGDPSIEVLVMMQHRDGSVGFLPWQYDGSLVAPGRVPSAEVGRRIAQQRLRLPHVFSFDKVADAAIAELERRNREMLAEWQQCSWLHGELILLLDEQCRTTLCGYILAYNRENGLSYTKEERDETS